MNAPHDPANDARRLALRRVDVSQDARRLMATAHAPGDAEALHAALWSIEQAIRALHDVGGEPSPDE